MPRFNLSKIWSSLRSGVSTVVRVIRRKKPEDSDTAQIDDRQIVLGLSKSRIPTPSQLKYLPAVLRPRERIWLQWFSFIGLIAVIILGVQYLSRHIELTPRSGGTLTEGLVGVPQYINPVLAQINTADIELTALTFRGLMKMDNQFQLTPGLAEKVVVSPDGKEYTITLLPDLFWSDGQPLTTRDVEYTISTMGDPAYKSPLVSIFQSVTVEVVDDLEVIIRIEEPLAPFLSYLTVGLIPEHLWLDATPQTFSLAELNIKPVSNGPYMFHNLTKDRDGNILSYQFVRNDYYHGQRPYLDKVIVKFYPDHPLALDALKSHSVDALGNINYEDKDLAAKAGDIKTFSISQLTAVFVNQKTNGALKSKAARLALSYATDRQAVIDEALKGNGNPIVGPILEGYLGYNPGLLRYDYDLNEAVRILEEDGWKESESGIRQKDEQQLTFTFTIVDQPVFVAVANQLAEEWRKIGAQVQIIAVEASRMQRDVLRPRDYEALLFGQIFNTDPDPYPFWHSSQQSETGFNLSIFFNSKMDEDLEHGRTTTSNEERAVDYFDFQNILAEEVPAIFLYQHHYLYAHPKSLRGIVAERLISGAERFQHIETWYTKTWPTWVKEKSTEQ